jgi:hypothetical protein
VKDYAAMSAAKDYASQGLDTGLDYAQQAAPSASTSSNIQQQQQRRNSAGPVLSSSDSAYERENRGQWHTLTLSSHHMDSSTLGVEGLGSSGGTGFGSMAHAHPSGSGGRRSGSLSSADGEFGHHFGYNSRGNG